MKTINRPTASNNSTPQHIEALATRVRKLWATDLWSEPEDHEARVLALMDLELDLERLSMRSRSGAFSSTDEFDLQRCRDLLVAIERERDRSILDSAVAGIAA